MRKEQFGFSRSKFVKDEDGHILLYFTIMLPVIIGMIGLALDGGAFLHLNTDLQELADAAALAGAAELDGQSGARARATNKAETLLSNDPHWSNVASSGLQIVDPPLFYSALDPVNGDTAATGDGNATFIKVITVTRQVAPNFIPATAAMLGLGTPSNNQTSASAVAQSLYVACNVQPLMICNPWEQAADPVFANHVSPGTAFRLLQEGGNSFAPGDFGLVDPEGSSHSSANDIRNLLSQVRPNFCFGSNISPRTGQVTQKVLDGVNVRFNMPPNGNTSGVDQTPAPNVIKGLTNGNPPNCPQGQWNPNNATQGPALPPDDTVMNNVGSASIGNGTMDSGAKNTYWLAHHNANWPADITTRYAAYQREQGIGGAAPGWAPGSEANAPYCTPTTPGLPDRRVVSAAVVNCLQNNIQGNSNGNFIRNTIYADFFVTKPADTKIYLELIRIMTPVSDGSKLHHIVQLNR